MARISELHFSNSYATSSGVSEFVEVALDPAEDPANYSIVLYNADGTAGLTVALDDPAVTVSFDAASGENVYVISTDSFGFLLTDPDSARPGNYEAVSLVDTSTSTVTNFLDIGGGTTGITAVDGLAAGATSTNVATPTAPRDATYTIQFNQPNPGTASFAAVSSGASGAICFGPGAMIRTPSGLHPVEVLRPGDLVETADHGARPIRWVGRSRVDARGQHAPIEVHAGTSLSEGGALLVSPNHRLWACNPRLALCFGDSEALVAAKHMRGRPGYLCRPRRAIVYFHLMFDQHELIWANGCLSESFYVSDQSLGAMSPAQRAEFAVLFPALMSGGTPLGALARPMLRRRESALLAA